MDLTPAQKNALMWLPKCSITTREFAWSGEVPEDMADTLFLMCDLIGDEERELVEMAFAGDRPRFRLTPAGIEARKAMEGK